VRCCCDGSGLVLGGACWRGMSEPKEGETQSQEVDLHDVIGRECLSRVVFFGKEVRQL
jgi:hypothetical protein